MGLRIDRVLYERFQKLSLVEKLRPGEAVEQLVRIAVETGSVAEVYAKASKPRHPGETIDEVLFSSRLSRLKVTLDYERTLLESGDAIDDSERMSDLIIEELAEIGRRSVGEKLIREFQKVIAEADRLYERSEKLDAEGLIDKRKPSAISLNQEATQRESPRVVPGN